MQLTLKLLSGMENSVNTNPIASSGFATVSETSMYKILVYLP